VNYPTERADLIDLASPDWLLAGFDYARELFQFARVSRQTYRDSSFLDHRIKPMPQHVTTATGIEVDLTLAKLGAKLGSRPAGYVFHTAFCASTLLALCLDHPSRTLVLREPKVLARLGGLRRDTPSAGSVQMDRLKRRVFGLLDRNYAEEVVVIKPSNFANSLVQDVLDERSRAGAQHQCLLLSNGLRNLIISILKNESEARERMPVFLEALLRDSDYLEQAGLPPLESLDLLQQSAVFWHCQRHFLQCIRSPSGSRQVLPVSMETFLLRPLKTLVAINEFLQLGLSEVLLIEVVERGEFRRHSKTGAGYGPEQQLLEAQAIAQRHDAEICRTLKWAAPLLRAMPVEPFSDDEEGFA
jgi:hypothetical protein